jgi:uncharacterized protein (TIGR03437 family)
MQRPRAKLFRIALPLLLAPLCAPAQSLTVDAAAGRHAINPGVYGINFNWDQAGSKPAAAADNRATMRRWGGNNTSRYHWQYDVWNIDSDWYFEVLPDTSVNASKLPNGSTFNRMVDQARVSGGSMIGTIPILGWLPKARQRMCSFSVKKYGAQCSTDPYWSDCGSGVKPDCKTNIVNDPTDASIQTDESLQRDWVKYLVSRYGTAAQGGVAVWSLDNEPVWWSGTHRDIHPNAQTYDETIAAGIQYARAIKDGDPTALVAGPISAGWESFYFSLTDCNAGWASRGVNGGANNQYWNNPIDRKAHGGIAFVPWYLQQFRTYDQKNGTHLLDVLDLHAYIAPNGIQFTSRGDANLEALRLSSTRVFWDPNYVASWLPDVEDLSSANYGKPVAPALVPRMKKWVADNYPGIQTAITEYNWGAAESITGALAQADILGIFGREGLDIGTLWGPANADQPQAFAFRLFRNYDGIGGAFGETSVQAATSDANRLAIFAAQRSDTALTVLVINKTTGDLTSPVALSHFAPATAAQVWRYTGAKLDGIVRDGDATVTGNAISATFPAYSATLFVIPADPASLPVPKPTIGAVTEAAAYRQSVAPGQMVIVWGANLGPAQIDSKIRVTSAGMVDTQMSGTRILFDGIPAPMVWTTAGAAAAVVPYFGATKSTTHVQVEYQGVRSDPFTVTVNATAPTLFTTTMAGSGQAAALNSDGVTLNSPSAPASAGSPVVLYGTGEGITDPPGVDGRPAISILPQPVATCTATIGGRPATIDYCGAAPSMMPGMFQINARIDPAVASGNAVPVVVAIGGVASQSGVTISVR